MKSGNTYTQFKHPLNHGFSRRSILKAIALLSLSPMALAQAGRSSVTVQKLHLFGMRVSNVQRSVAFYQGLFGMSVQARQGDTVCMRIGQGPQFFTISPVRDGENPGITHIGLSVPRFDIDSLGAQLEQHGFMRGTAPEPAQSTLTAAMHYWTVERSEVSDFYFADSEGLVFQLCSSNYCGGSGPDGSVCATLEAATESGLLSLVDINHFTNYMKHSPRANQFYLDLLGLSYQSYQGPTSPTIGVGDGKQFLMYVGGADEAAPTEPGRIDHVSMSVETFDVDTILGKLTGYGLTARENPSVTPPLSHWVSMRMPNRGGAEGGTPELYFSDPDGLHIQLQHVAYCGGGGYLGDQCSPI